MRIDDYRIGTLPAFEILSVFGHDRGRTCVSRIDVEPDAVFLANVSNSIDRIDARCRGRADGRDDAYRQITGLDVLFDSVGKFFGDHFKPVITLDLSQ